MQVDGKERTRTVPQWIVGRDHPDEGPPLPPVEVPEEMLEQDGQSRSR